MPAWGSWLRTERKGLPHTGSCLQQGMPAPCSQQEAPTEQSAPPARSSGSCGAAVRPSAARGSRRASGKPRGRGASRHPPPAAGWARVGQPALRRRKGQRQREKPRGGEGLLLVPGAAVSRTSPCTRPAVLLHISACLLACPCLRLPSGLAGSLKLFALLPTLPGTSSPSTVPFCASPFLASPPPLFFHSSRTLFCPLAWQNGISRFLLYPATRGSSQ